MTFNAIKSYKAILAAFVGALCLHAGGAIAAEQTAAEEQASKALFVPNLKLATPSSALKKRAINVAYVEKDTSLGSGKYMCGGSKNATIAPAMKQIEMAFSRLSAQAWENIELDYVLLCSNAQANGRDIGGIPVPPLKLLMLATGKDAVSQRLPYTSLHELYHLIELQNNSQNDNTWDKHFSGYNNSYGKKAGETRFGSGGVGFINGYARSFPHEERAELFSYILLNPTALNEYISKSQDREVATKIMILNTKCKQLLGADACL